MLATLCRFGKSYFLKQTHHPGQEDDVTAYLTTQSPLARYRQVETKKQLLTSHNYFDAAHTTLTCD
jgi:hypothetical protein